MGMGLGGWHHIFIGADLATLDSGPPLTFRLHSQFRELHSIRHFGGTMLEFVIFVVPVLILIVAWLNYEAKKSDTEREALQAEYAVKTEAFGLAREQFIQTEFGEAHPFDVKLDGKLAMLVPTPDERSIRVVQIANPHVWEVASDREIAFSQMRSVQFIQDDVVESYTRQVTTPVAVQKQKSAIGRGLVGAVALGPVGLVLGAASAMTPTTKITEHTTTMVDQRTVKGPPTVMITTFDHHNPFTRIEFSEPDDARAWALWMGDRLAA